MSDKELKAAKKELAQLSEFADQKAPELGKQSEMLMEPNHVCNISLKVGLSGPKKGLEMRNAKTGMVHIVKSVEDLVAFNEASMTTVVEENKINPETPEQRAIRNKENEETVKRLKAKGDRRKYNDLTRNIAGFENKDDIDKRQMLQESHFTMTFGFGFISLMFLGFISGYMFGRKILELDPLPSIFVSVFVGVVTMMTEMILMMFRINKLDKLQHAERKRNQLE